MTFLESSENSYFASFTDKGSTFFVELNGIKVRVFFRKNIEKKHLRRHNKSYYYFCVSNILVMNLSVGSRNMIKVSSNISLLKIR